MQDARGVLTSWAVEFGNPLGLENDGWKPDSVRTLSYEATIDDPGAYINPWSARWTITQTTASKWIPGGEMFEYICQDDAR